MKTVSTILLVIMAVGATAQGKLDPFISADNYGGRREFKRIIRQEMVYPEASLKAGIGGHVSWLLIIKKSGEPIFYSQTASVNEELDKEALKLLRLLEFKPASYWGDPVDSYLEMTIKFDPKYYYKVCKKRGYENIFPLHLPADTSLMVYLKVDKIPVFNLPGETLTSFLFKNMKFPNEAIQKGLTGTVMVNFVVETSGMVTNIRIKKGVGGGCNEEAMRLISQTRWTPGILKETAVRTRVTIPISFYLNKPVVGETEGEQRR
jgi:TonB family protein